LYAVKIIPGDSGEVSFGPILYSQTPVLLYNSELQSPRITARPSGQGGVGVLAPSNSEDPYCFIISAFDEHYGVEPYFFCEGNSPAAFVRPQLPINALL